MSQLINYNNIPKAQQSYSWIDYTIDNNGVAVLDLVESYGYPEASNRETLKRIVFAFLNEFGEEATHQLTKIHPDYKLFNPIQQNNYQTIQNQNNQPLQQPTPQKSITSLNDDEFFKKIVIMGLLIIGIVQILKVTNA